MMQDVHDIFDIIAQTKLAFGHRNQARINPVSDINIMIGQHGLHCAAQQSCIVPRHRRNNQQFGIFLVIGWQHALEMQQVAEWTAPDDFLMN